MECILLIHKNASHVPPEESPTSDMQSEDIRNQELWNDFLAPARGSGIFSGGSAISRGELILKLTAVLMYLFVETLFREFIRCVRDVSLVDAQAYPSYVPLRAPT